MYSICTQQVGIPIHIVRYFQYLCRGGDKQKTVHLRLMGSSFRENYNQQVYTHIINCSGGHPIYLRTIRYFKCVPLASQCKHQVHTPSPIAHVPISHYTYIPTYVHIIMYLRYSSVFTRMMHDQHIRIVTHIGTAKSNLVENKKKRTNMYTSRATRKINLRFSESILKALTHRTVLKV